MDIVGNLTSQQRDEARLLDYSIAYFRTVAGVHYDSDNRAGLALGRYVVLSKLPQYLASKYSCDDHSYQDIFGYVEAKIAKMKQDHPLRWHTWMPDYFHSPSKL